MKIRVTDIFLFGHLMFFVVCSFIYIFSGLKPTANSLTFDTYVACILLISLLRSNGLQVGWITVGFFLYVGMIPSDTNISVNGLALSIGL